MVSGSTHAMKRTMLPPAWRKCALMSSKVKQIDGPVYFTMALMAAVMSSPLYFIGIICSSAMADVTAGVHTSPSIVGI